jgi:DNA-binding response OmpR family regulator
MNHKIMLIEDDHTMLSLLNTLLTMEGFQMVPVGDDQFENILSKIIIEQPDIILMDVNLRQGNGLDLLSSIRSNSALANIRVIMSSGMDYKNECLNKGAQGFIMKPYMPNDLIKILRPTPVNI